MTTKRPDVSTILKKDDSAAAQSVKRILEHSSTGEHVWIDETNAANVEQELQDAYQHAHTIMKHLVIQGPTKHNSGHPGGPLSSFTFSFGVNEVRNPHEDQPMRMSPGHLSLLSFGLEWMFGREGADERLQSPEAIIDTFRTPSGLPGHIEAGIGTIPFGTGPLGKGVSNALGVAFGLQYQGKPGMVDVLLADGDAQEGQVWEAFRLAPHLALDNLVVHGDFNDMQLSCRTTEVFSSDFANMAYSAGWNVIEVQNGNDLAQVYAALEAAKGFESSGRPTFICYYTTMGHGIELMEEGSNSGTKNYHGSPLSAEVAEEELSKIPPLEEAVEGYSEFQKKMKARFVSGQPTQTDIPLDFAPSGYKRSIMEEKGAARKEFGATHLLALMKADERIVVLHADLAGSGGFNAIEKEMPKRVVNVGVAEANMYMMAAGMRQTGLLPVTYTFAAFGTYEARANARLIDINCQHTRVGILNDCTHAGLSVGEDGETHQERNYLNIPLDNTQVWCSADSNQSGAMAEKALEIICEGHQSVYTFFPRSGHEQIKTPSGELVYSEGYVFDGKADLIRGSGDTTDQVTVLATGITVHAAIAAADALAAEEQPVHVRVLNVACVRPIDSAAVIQAAMETQHLIVVEDHHSEGGLATQVADIIADFGLPCTLRRLGVNHYFPSAPAKDLEFMAGIDAESIADAVQDEIRTEVCGGEDAFVSALHELIHNVQHSRFAQTALPFLRKLTDEKGYAEGLRSYLQTKSCPPEKLPTTEDLLKKISGTTEDLLMD